MKKSSPFHLAAIQMCSGDKPAQNLDHAAALIAQAAQQGARLVALPEYFALISPDEKAKLALAEAPGQGNIQRFLSECAQPHKIWLVAGSLALKSDQPEKIFNSLMVYNPSGQNVLRYDKIHLFSFQRGEESYGEAKTILPGTRTANFELEGWRVGVGICYDLRFPEQFRAMGEIDLLILPAAFTHTTGQAHWEILLRARAIENQCYVLAPAQGGIHPGGRQTYGHSLLIDPWGKVLACRADTGEGLILGALDAHYLKEIRTQLPALQHRRFMS